MKKRVNEIFHSLQGEGFWTGIPMVFIRFSGCNLACDFCDTVHEAYTEMSVADILARIERFAVQRVCLTGGEPSLQADDELIEALHRQNRIIHVETNGTHPLPANIDWITVSPKTDHIALAKANEIKMVYQNRDISAWLDFEAEHYYLQPCSCTCTEQVIDYIKEHPPWRLSVQLHKLLNFR
ncbi:MAG: 7-carboxy-7-deazaguanine synthase QueE [Bacteroidales bacterium]|jgi:organic radical activating enzyme|nr:7-carboxy-7-deazaguanine synthase QueE [Bacteroidales bacterium]